MLAELRRRMEQVGRDRVGAALRAAPPDDPLPAGPSRSGPISQQMSGVMPVGAPTAVSTAAGAQVLEVPQPLRAVLPRGGLPRGSVVSLSGGRGSTSLLLALLGSAGRSWTALVGLPGLGLLAAAEFGLDLNRVVVVPDPGPDVLQVLSVLADGVDLLVVDLGGQVVPPGRLRVLTGRLRQRGTVLLAMGSWPGAELVLDARAFDWSGVGDGHGRFRDRSLEVAVRGRGVAGRERRATLLLHSDRNRVWVTGPQASEQPGRATVVAATG